MGFLHVGVDDIFEFLLGFPHDVDILDVQEDELCILVLITLVASSGGLRIAQTVGMHLYTDVYNSISGINWVRDFLLMFGTNDDSAL